MRNDKKIIVVSAQDESCYEDEHEVSCSMTEIKTVQDFLQHVCGNNGATFWSEIIPEAIKDPNFVMALSDAGFKRADRVKAFADKATMTGDFYIYNPKSQYDRLSSFYEEVPYKAKDLASSTAVLLVGVNKACIKELSPKAYSEMLKEKERLKVSEEARKVREKKSEEKKKLKAIEKAKKILEEAGVKNEEA